MQWCIERNRTFICFDYSGHGQSSGQFIDHTLGDWLEDATQLFDYIPDDQKILIGSSMGGWVSLLLAQRRKDQVAGIITLACAADFITDILIPHLSDEDWLLLNNQGITHIPSDYEDKPFAISKRLLDEAGQYEVLKSPINLDCPIELIHGMSDNHIPWETSLRALEKITGDKTKLTLIKSGTHRLSRPEDLETTQNILDMMLCQLSESS